MSDTPETELKARIDEEMTEYSNGAYADHGSARDMLQRFAADVIAAEIARAVAMERERCAKVCEEFNGDGVRGVAWGARFASLIRAG